MDDLDEDQRALAAASGLSRRRVLDADAAGKFVGGSRSTIANWRQADPPVPHEPRPGKRPAHLFSEYEVVAHALTAEPRWRSAALDRIREATPATESVEADQSDADSIEAAASVTASNTPHAHDEGHDTGAAVRERDRLRAENARLTEQMERVLDMLNEESKSRRRQVKKFIASVRAGNVPGNTQALDDLIGE